MADDLCTPTRLECAPLSPDAVYKGISACVLVVPDSSRSAACPIGGVCILEQTVRGGQTSPKATHARFSSRHAPSTSSTVRPRFSVCLCV